MESILEYKGEQQRLKVPKWVVKDKKWLDANVTIDTEPEVFEDRYNKLQEWYEKKASVMFGNSDLFMEGFFNHTKEMEQEGVIDYCKFIDF